MSKALLILCAVMLAGCLEPQYKQVKASVLPDELKDCSFFDVRADDGSNITIVRCPNSTTSANYRQGKAKRTTVVKDGND